VDNATVSRTRKPRPKAGTSYFQALWPLVVILVGSWFSYFYFMNDSLEVARSIGKKDTPIDGALGAEGAAKLATFTADSAVVSDTDAAAAAASASISEPVGQGGFRGRNPADIAAAEAEAARRAQLEEEGRVMAQERHERDRVEVKMMSLFSMGSESSFLVLRELTSCGGVTYHLI